MNYLAHCVLSCQQESLLIGNFLGDMVRNRELDSFPADIQRGIFLHRQIDSYTDQHALVRQATRRLHARHGKYATVIVDVYYDYFLAKNWRLFAPKPMEEFQTDVYEILLKGKHHMPERIQNRVDRMVADRWLRHYTTLPGLEATFHRISPRLSKPYFLEGVMTSLVEQEELLNEEFLTFFPEVVGFVEEWCGNC